MQQTEQSAVFFNIIILTMPIKRFLFASTLCLCLYSVVSFNLVKSTTIYNEQVIADGTVPPGDGDVKVSVDTAEPLNHIEEYFLSFNIDSQEFGEHFEKMNFRLLLFFGHPYAAFS